jgi:mannose-6-phosphate isomerase-like protein (cupin superfamily)
MEISERPWGKYEVLTEADGYKVKRITVLPSGRLSLQSHERRAEHWVVVTGTAKVTVDEAVNFKKPGQSVYIPQGAIHRLENETDENMVLIEVQTGTYLGEDDIKRYEDIYGRSE